MEPELGRDATVAVILIAAIVALATGSVVFGIAVLGTVALVLGAVALIGSRGDHTAPAVAPKSPGAPASPVRGATESRRPHGDGVPPST